jgi:hypothetical protein
MLYAYGAHYKIELPTYSFEKNRYWVEPDSVIEAKKKINTFYKTEWKLKSLSPLSEDKETRSYLIYINSDKRSNDIVRQLKNRNNKIICVKIGSSYFHNTQENAYTINPNSKTNHGQLFKSFKENNIKFDRIIYLWLLDESYENRGITFDNINRYLNIGYCGLYYIIQEIANNKLAGVPVITIVTDNLYYVTGGETVSLGKVIVKNAIGHILIKYPYVNWIDIDSIDKNIDKLSVELIKEILFAMNNLQVAYRNNMRWVMSLELVKKNVFASDLLSKNKTYIVSSEVVGKELSFAKYITNYIQVNIILIMSEEFPSREEWCKWLKEHDSDNNISKKILQIQEMELSGNNIFMVTLNIKNLNKICDVFGKITDKIDGIFYLSSDIPEDEKTHMHNKSAFNGNYKILYTDL